MAGVKGTAHCRYYLHVKFTPTLRFSLDQEPGCLPGNITKGKQQLFPGLEAMVAMGPLVAGQGRVLGPRGQKGNVGSTWRRDARYCDRQPLHDLPRGQNCTHSHK